MALERIRLTDSLPTKPATAWAAWIDGEQHTKMTGGAATSDPRVGGEFTAWGGYIKGVHLALTEGSRVVQTWRTSEFDEEHSDSRLEVIFEDDDDGGTKITIIHSDLPEGTGAQYEQGWMERYIAPMQAYFRG